MTSRVRAVLQSRLSSSRLPGKALLTVGDRPIVVLAAQRAGNTGHEVVVATSVESTDDAIAAACRRHAVPVVRGSLDDTLARFLQATADLDDSDVVVRLTGDNVVPDGELISLLVDALHGPDAAGRRYVRLGGDDPQVPYGVAGEAFTAGVLREAAKTATEPGDHEHVTPAVRRLEGDWRITPPDPSPTWRGLRCTVDTFDDFVVVSRLLSAVDDPLRPSWRNLCDDLANALGPRHDLPVRRDNPLRQSALVLGTVQLGLAYGAANNDGKPDATTAADVLAAAASLGVTHLDTARAYGDSERRIGSANARGLGERVAVVTKLQPLSEGAGTDAARASLERSLRMLRSDQVAAVLVHRADDWHRPGVVDVLTEAVEDGTAQVVGASVSTPEELVTLLADARCGYVQIPFNIVDRRWLSPEVQQAIAARPDVIVTARSAFLQGLLTAGTEAHWPLDHDAADYVPMIDELVGELGRVSRADLCIAYVLGHSWVTSVVVGAESAKQVIDLAALVRAPHLTTEELDVVRKRVPGAPEGLVDPSRWSSS